MPPISSVESILDGFRITKNDGVVITFTSADLPNVVKKTNDPAQYETYMNTWITNATKYIDPDGVECYLFYAKVHVYSVNPMVAIAAVSDNPIPNNWW